MSIAIVSLLAPPAGVQAQGQGQASAGRPASSPQTQTQLAPVSSTKPDAKKAKAAYEEGADAERRQEWQNAYTSYTDAVNWAPDNREYFLRREIAKSRLVQTKVDSAERYAVLDRLDDARRELLSATYLDPANTIVRQRLAELSAAEPGQLREIGGSEPGGPVRLAYQTGVQNFDYRGDTQGAYQQLARQFGVEVAFDVDLRPVPVRFRFDGLDFPTAARLLGDMTKTFWRPLASRLLFVAEDTAQKRRDYDVSAVRTVLLPASETPDEMTEIFRLVREITGITRSQLDTRTRTITLRASPQAIAVATDLISNLEQPTGELILEIEILEVNRNYARQLGITPPQSSQILMLTSQELQAAQQSLAGLVGVITQLFGQPSSLSGLTSTQIASLLSSGQVGLGTLLPPVVAFGGGESTFLATMPGASANFSQMLSLVRHGRRVLLRAQDGQPATFFVGDRIPVSLATFSSSLSGTNSSITGVATSNFPVTNFSTGTSPAYVATASLRDNSVNDLIVANSADNTIGVLLGDGTGTFGTQTTFPAGANPVWIATGQLNGNTSATNNDLFLDLAVANKGANTVSIFLGNDDGTFQPKTDIAVGNTPVSVVAGNFHDLSTTANVDLAVANQSDNTISILQGNGDGTFGPPIGTSTLLQLPTGFSPSALAVASFTNSGHLDLAVTDQGNNSISIFLGNGDGTFKARTDYAVGNSPVWVSTGDFDGDGFLDLAIANNGASTATNSGNSVTILLDQKDSNGSPTGIFAPLSPAQDIPAGNGPTSIAVGDYNVDGRPDLAVTDKTDNAVSLILNLGGALFGPNLELPVGSAPVSIATADFNGDGSPDVAIADSSSNEISVVLDSSTLSGGGTPFGGTAFPGIEYLDVGLKVNATPRIHPDNDVTLQLGFNISTVTGQSINAIPVISSQTVQQTVRLKQNETAVMAGFLQTQVTNAILGTPGVAGLPVITDVLQNNNAQNTNTEVLILLTPRVVRLAPRKDHVIYAGQGSLDNAAGALNPGIPNAPLPLQPVQPAQPPQPTGGQQPQAQPPQSQPDTPVAQPFPQTPQGPPATQPPAPVQQTPPPAQNPLEPSPAPP